MLIDPENIATVIISNNSESTTDYLKKAGKKQKNLIELGQRHGDRACFWLREKKLVITSYPIPHLYYLQQTVGYADLHHLSPQNPTVFLSLDILREPHLLDAIVTYAGETRTLKLIPYATTQSFLQLVSTLRSQYNLTVILPESPELNNLWVRDYINTKSGFRTLVSQWLVDVDPSWPKFPKGTIAQSLETAAEMAYWFVKNGRDCIVKIDDGAGGMGQERFAKNCDREPGFSSSTILQTLKINPFFMFPESTRPIVVEEWIQSEQILSPSIECFVPPLGQGNPKITYLGNQLFLEPGRCAGVLIAKELLAQQWYHSFAEVSLLIAQNLQSMGYVGHFDIDAVVNDRGKLFLLESNPRRTGTTSVHEFAQCNFGSDYLNRVVLLSDDEMNSGDIDNFEELLERVGDLQYSHQQLSESSPNGIVITIASLLKMHLFGCLIIAGSTDEAVALHQKLKERLG